MIADITTGMVVDIIADKFEAELKKAQELAESAGYTEADVNNIIKSVRKNKR